MFSTVLALMKKIEIEESISSDLQIVTLQKVLHASVEEHGLHQACNLNAHIQCEPARFHQHHCEDASVAPSVDLA